jgi:GNAT superfamily N-acetyltransferase
MRVRGRTPEDQDWIEGLLHDRWSSTTVIAHGTTFDAANLPGLVAGEREGLVTYVIDGTRAELVTLDAVTPRRGTGTALVEALVEQLKLAGVRQLSVTTTNDNLDALRFYQRRGFRLAALRVGAMDATRQSKPQIPGVGAHGIPLRDEIELRRELI